MGKAKRKAKAEDEPIGVYRCPNCNHRWEAWLNWNASCPKCEELQGPVCLK